MITYPTAEMKEAVKEMWRICFLEGEPFLDLYFSRKYSPGNTLALLENGRMQASLQMLPYDLSFYGQNVKTGYISGAATMPEARNKGYMADLLRHSFNEMKKKGMLFSTLIPAEEWLFNFYRKFGYETVFYKFEKRIKRIKAQTGNVKDYAPEDFDGFSRLYMGLFEGQNLAVLKTKEDIVAVVLDHYMGGGRIFLSEEGGSLSGYCFAIMDGEGLIIKEARAKTRALEEALINHALAAFSANDAVYVNQHGEGEKKPLGMARILDLENVLKIYEKANPDEKDKEETKKLSSGEICRLVFGKNDKMPYMSLMLN